MPRLVDVEELGGRDLRQADGRDVADVLAEDLVHLLVDALRLDWRFLEMGPAQHGLLALAAFADPAGPILDRPARLPFARGLDEQLERGFRIRDDPEIRVEHPADLRRLDVHVNELASLGVDVHRAGVAVRPAIADPEHEVGREHGRVAVAVRGLKPDHAGHQRVVVRDRAPAHEGRDHGNPGQLGELDEQRGSVGVDDSAARDDERALGLVHHVERPVDLGAGRVRLVDRQRLVGLDVELDLCGLHVEGEIDRGPAPAGRTA